MPKNPLVLYDMDEDSPPSKRSFLSKNDNIDVPVKDESDATKELNRVRDELFLAMQNQEKMKRKIYELEKNAIHINFEKKAATTEAAIMEMKCESFEGEKEKDFEKIKREYEALISKERKEKEKIVLESSKKERQLISKISKTLIQKLKAETQLENAQNAVINYQTIIDKVQQQFDEEKTQNEEKHQQEILCFKSSLTAVRKEMQRFKDIELEKQRHQMLNELSGIKREFLHRLKEAQKNEKVERKNYQAFKNKIHQKLAVAETLLKQKEAEVEKLKKQIGDLMEENRKQKQKWQQCSGTQCLTNKISHFEGSEQSGSSSTLFYPMPSPLPTPIEICKLFTLNLFLK
uniref:Uncharacterized protein n=1 Tax=Panagrolaimus superbus TaxID=310955 RepID=A0A914YP06_9BILA